MLDLPVNLTSESIHTSLTVLLDPTNFWVAVGTLLLSYIQTEIYDIAYVHPVNVGYVRFTSHPDVRECLH